MKRSFIFIMGLIILTCTLIITGCSSQPEKSSAASPSSTNALSKTSAPVYGGIVKFRVNTEGENIGYPSTMLNANDVIEASPCLEPLVIQDDSGNYLPWLASDIKTDAAAKTVTFPLRKGVKFHDGTDLDATAVKWNLDQSLKAKTVGSKNIKSIDVVDNNTVRINLSQWDNTLLYNLSQRQYMGYMISQSAFEKNGADWSAKNPIGTGPFQFVNWTLNSKVVYKKFDTYWQTGKPYACGAARTFRTHVHGRGAAICV